MKKSTVLSLMSFAGIAAGLAGLAAADYTAGPFAGPYTLPLNLQFQSIDLNGAAAPAGTYGKATMQADWAPSTDTVQWQSDSKGALTNVAISGVTTIPAANLYYGATGGTTPPVSVASATAGTVRWNNVTLSTPFIANGANSIFFTFRSSYAGNAAATRPTYSNIIVTLAPPPPPPANATCGTALDLSASLNAGLTAPGTSVQTSAIDITGADATAFAQCNAVNGARTVFYTFTPSTTAGYSIARGSADTVTAGQVFSITSGDCATPVSVVCGATSVVATLTAGTTYTIQQSRTGTTGLGAAESAFALVVARTETATCGANTEVEPNETKANATPVVLALGDTICGTTTGTSTTAGIATSVDTYRIQAPPFDGIKLNRLRVVGATPGYTFTLRGLTQATGAVGSPGVIAPASDATFVTAQTTSTPTRYLQWYTLGTVDTSTDRAVYVRVAGATTTTAQYSLNMINQDTVVPVDASRTVRPGSISISTVGQTGATQSDTDLWVYDSSFNAIPLAGNDDSKVNTASAGSDLTRTYTAGTYYIAVGLYNTGNNQASPADEDFQLGNVMDFPGVIASSSTTSAPTNVSIKITDSDGDVPVALSTSGIFTVAFAKMVVAPPAPTRCQPADIADDAGNPLPSDGANNGVNEGDYNAFFNNFFTNQAIGSPADIANDDGSPLPPFGPAGGTNNGVNEGDYNAFFNNFFNGCPV
ncbi:hypothetical protein BH11PLA1_BH11PLA1_23060 [soil metagenome]